MAVKAPSGGSRPPARRRSATKPAAAGGRGQVPRAKGESPTEGDLDALQARLGRFLKDPGLLRQALLHPSAAAEAGLPRLRSYERLEFLGDALVNLALAEMVFDRFPKADEGVLTRMRAYWVSQPSLAQAARRLFLQDHVRLGTGESRQGGGQKERLLASVFEAVVGAIYLDGGLGPVRKLAAALWADAVRKRGVSVLQEDAKTALQEIRQASGLPLPIYETAPSGDGFVASVFLDGAEAGKGTGASRKAAEQAAARTAIEALDEGRRSS